MFRVSVCAAVALTCLHGVPASFLGIFPSQHRDNVTKSRFMDLRRSECNTTDALATGTISGTCIRNLTFPHYQRLNTLQLYGYPTAGSSSQTSYCRNAV